MNLLDVFGYPFAILGCLVGFALAAVLHFVFPETETLIVQALLVAIGTLLGMWLEWKPGRKNRRG